MWIRLMWGLPIAGACGCASVGTIDVGRSAQLVLVIETPQPIGKIEFQSEDSMPFLISGITPGTTLYRKDVRPGEYCLVSMVSGDMNAGYMLRPRQPMCVAVEPGQMAYAGHFVVDPRGLRRVVDRDRLESDLHDPDVRKEGAKARTE